MRGSQHEGAGFSTFTSPVITRKGNQIHPANQSLDGGLFNMQTIGIRPQADSPQSRPEQGYIGDN
jgi:hypothetical protein